MISRRYGVRSVRHGPASLAALADRMRCLSDHSLTVSDGSGARPAANLALAFCRDGETN